MKTNLINYLVDNWIEITGAVLSLIYLYLSIKEKIGLWIFGFLCSAFYIVVFFDSKFYADMSLQVYYLIMSVYGWIHWHRKSNTETSALPISQINKNQYKIYGAAIIVVYAAYYFVLKRFTDSTIPITDSVVGALSVAATWMLAKKKIENWLLWIVADGLAVGLFIYKDLYPTAILFVVYTLMAVSGYFQWRKTMSNEKGKIV